MRSHRVVALTLALLAMPVSAQLSAQRSAGSGHPAIPREPVRRDAYAAPVFRMGEYVHARFIGS
jgi:hypothetical protein